jgi:hypothetical protein
MQFHRTTLILIFLASLTLTALTACGPQATAAVSEAYVTTLAEEKMQALNDGDYATFTADFSDVLIGAIPEDSFQDLQETILGASGRFESVTGLRLTNARTSGYVNYIVTCQFEEEEVLLTLVYAVDGEQVEGIFFNAPKLNQAMQAR